MSGSLRDAFDDLAADAAPDIVRDDLATVARDLGRRRQRRRRLVGATLALGLAAAVLAVALPMTGGAVGLPPAGDAGHGVTSYPQRIGHQWRVSALPDRPGPIAGLMKDATHWYAVAADGHRWRLPTTSGPEPALSPDGRRIWYQLGSLKPYVVHDLVTGERTGSTAATAAREGTYYVTGNGYWSPDGRTLAVNATRRGADTAALLLGPGGAVTPVPNSPGHLTGWAGDDTLLWRLDDGVTGQVTRLDGEVVRTVRLRPSPDWRAAAGHWVVSPDGAQVLVRESGPADTYLRRFSLADGAQIGTPTLVPGWDADCRDGWAGSTPAVSLVERDGGGAVAGTALGTDGLTESIVAVEPRLRGECLVWASDALAGGPHRMLFGRSTLLVTWWWREILLAVLAVGGLLALRGWSERRYWREIMGR